MTAAAGSSGAPQELDLDEQIAAYQREFPEVDPHIEKVVTALGRLNRRMNVAYGRQLVDLGISNSEWEVLKALVVVGRPYRLGPGDLAKRLGLTPAAMTHRIDRMVNEGLVTRDRDEANRVRVIVELTEEGRDKWLADHAARRRLRGRPPPGPHPGRARDARRDPHPAAASGGATQPDAGGRLEDLD